MSADLRDLYQEIILDHNKRPRNFREIADGARRAEGYNPLCGDRITVFVALDGGRIRDASFQGSGCAISRASASLMTEAVRDKSVEEAERLFEQFHAMVTSPPDKPAAPEGIGKLAAFAGVAEYPARVKCASLAWHTLKAALEDGGKPVSTE